MAEEMSFAEAEGLEGKERKGRKVKWLIQLLLLLWIRKIFSSHQVSKSISWHLDLFAAVSFFSESRFLKGIEKCGCRSKERIQLSPGFMLTLLPEHFPSCSCAKGALHLGKAHCAEQVESAGSGQHEPAAKQNLGGLASGALTCTKPGVGAWFKTNP